MEVRLDKAGRIVVPKRAREALHLRTGDKLDVEVDDDGIKLKRPPRKFKLVKGRHGLLTAPPDSGIPDMTLDEILDAVRQARR